MANPSQTPKQNLVRRYIIGKLFPACGKEPMPLNELAIARKFGVNRLTVRKVCADLVQDHSLITIPGRRGLFINPDYVMMRGARRFIGVICSVRKLSLIEKSNFQILSAFDSAMDDCDGDYQFLSIASDDPQEMVDEICSNPLTGLLWLIPKAEDLPVFEKVVESGLPAVAVAPSYYDEWKPPRSNAVLYDHKSTGRSRARTVIRSGVRSPAYLALRRGETFSAFCQEFRNSGLPGCEDRFLPIEPSSYPKIRSWIRTGKIDSLVMDGLVMISFRDFCQAVPELKRIPLFTDDSPRTHLISVIDPELQIRFFSYSLHFCEQAGKCAAEMMKQLIQKHGGRVENRMVSVSEDEMDTDQNNLKGSVLKNNKSKRRTEK